MKRVICCPTTFCPQLGNPKFGGACASLVDWPFRRNLARSIDGLVFWDFYLSLQMFNHRIYRKDQPIRGGRKFAFQTDPADYDEIGQSYRRKSIRLEIALLSWMLAPVVLFAFLGIIFTK